jgi:hypothetical protein
LEAWRAVRFAAKRPIRRRRRGIVLALASQFEREDAAIESKSLLDVTHLQRNVIDAHQPGFIIFGHDISPRIF